MAIRFSTGLQNLQAGINRELVPYGAMTLDADVQTNWTESGSTMLGAVTKVAKTCMSLSGIGYASTPIVTKIGHWYRVSVAFINEDATGAASVRVGTAADGAQNYDSGSLATTTATWTTLEFGFRATATTTYITLKNSGASLKYFDDVSCSTLSASIKEAFHLGDLQLWTGPQPDTPDEAPTGTLLVTVKNGSSGITFGDAVAGLLSKTVGETLTGTCVAAGTAGWFRLRAPGDLGTLNTIDARIDGLVETLGEEMTGLRSLVFALNSVQTIADLHPYVKMSNE